MLRTKTVERYVCYPLLNYKIIGIMLSINSSRVFKFNLEMTIFYMY